MKVIAIYTDFRHHGEDSGYKQILKFIKPYRIFGINERDEKQKVSGLKSKYQWLFEIEAFLNRGDAELVHILYGEDYFRWSTRIFKKLPVVATFHQPAPVLLREVSKGDYRGRVGRLIHLLNKSRFKNLKAAIVTNEEQKEVLKQVMPASRIYVIPLGVHLNHLNDLYQNFLQRGNQSKEPYFLTVGNWLRDWDFFIEVAKQCSEYKFVVVNHALAEDYKLKLSQLSNVSYKANVSDDELFDLYLKARAQFIPVTGLAASNALIQGLALGCPLVLTDLSANSFESEPEAIKLYEQGNLNDCIKNLKYFMQADEGILKQASERARTYAMDYSWERISVKTIKVYEDALKST